MAQFYSAKSNKTKHLSQKISLTPTALDHQGQAVAEHQGKVVFVPGLLPGESAQVQLVENKARFARAKVLKRTSDHPQRITPPCPHFARCGGCQLQFAPTGLQRDLKQQALAQVVSKLSGLTPEQWAEPLQGPDWHYRRRARLGCRYDAGELVLGFRQEGSNRLTAIDHCPVLAEPLSELITPLQQLLAPLKLARHVGHLDLMLASEGSVVVVRLLRPLREEEREALAAFGQSRGVQMLIQGDALTDLSGQAVAPLHYDIGEGRPQPAFLPGDFFQVNGAVNQAMISQAIEWLQPQPGEKGLDLFCGGGNFTLALAGQSAEIIGVEGVPAMVERARARAAELGLEQLRFEYADLNGEAPKAQWLKDVDWVLLDPARAGAPGVMEWLAKLRPSRILYVACNPASLGRDGKVLAQQGYRLSRLGLVDMFPHTHHLESMALFEPGNSKHPK
ncbi:23S rRNA (uracil(1939)-C(5))-methyltransferase RlmD [Ferrimonas balearica]|uniref:23S rRNA (uracil(1939)-C(5))-methyltransferase RlmD n=1 Tax=Ferrimonas balearica TaxID=44012 RepID=UPI001C97B7D9|nr:23S rRNA (uracil(1939)-C(5))-methyltransferase RlmD [Ferrimonas balearica]MBY6224871.1 23S rRNA (uracil(1939)-C(5))-methyltransferase RlmD [Ferrimonas balearica]